MASDRGDDLSRLLADTAWVRTLALRIVGDAHLADDLSQDTLLAALSQPHPEAEDRRRSWLARVLHNLAKLQRRQGARRVARERRAARPEALPPSAEVVEQTELQQRVVAEVLALPEPYRGTLLLRYMRGQSLQAIAREHRVTVATTRSRSHRGIAMLRARMQRALGPMWHRALGAIAITKSHAPAPIVASPAWAPTLLFGVSMKLAGYALVVSAAAVSLVLVSLHLTADQPAPPTRPLGSTDTPPPATETARAPAPSRDHVESPTISAPPAERGPRHTGPGTVLAGTVQTRDEQPIEDAEVTVLGAPLEALRSGRRVRPAAQTTTDAAGAFAVPGLPASVECVLYVAAEGYASAWTEVRPGDGATIRLDPAGRVWGTVLDGRIHRPVAGVRVRTRTVSLTSGRIEVTAESVSDDGGRYELRRLPAGQEILLEVLQRGSTPLVQRVLLDNAPHRRHDILLPDHGTLEGVVVADDDQRPVPSAAIRSGSADARVLTKTDAGGRFSLRLLSRPTESPRDAMLRGQRNRGGDSFHNLAIHAPGFCQTIQPIAPLLAAQGAARITVVRAGGIAGTVVDGTGSPVADATLDWRTAGQILLEPGAWVEPAPNSLRAQTDANGAFSLLEVLPGIPGASLAVRRLHHAPHHALDVGPRHAGEVRNVRIQLDTGVAVRGHTTVDGRPEKAYVHLVGDAGPQSGLMIRTDADGHFVFHGVLPGDYTIKSCTADGTAVWSDPVELEIGAQPPAPLSIPIATALDMVRGLVVTADGQPLANHDVFAFPGDQTSGILAGMGRTDDGGAFELRLTADAAGTYTLAIPWEGFRVFAAGLRPGTHNARLTAPTVVPVTLSLVRAGTLEPIAAAELAMRRSSTEPWAALFDGREVATSPAGDLALRLPAGHVELRVTARAAGLDPTTRSLRVTSHMHARLEL
ncbi:MAG: sigma-70 family RNA polymerase sigma factor [Planctomycetota bacterium]